MLPRHLRRWWPVVFSPLVLSGCGSEYVVFHPAGPVAATELHLIELSAAIMAGIVLLVWGLLAYILVRFRDTPNNPAPYLPNWRGTLWLEAVVFGVPVLVLLIVAVPTIKKTYALDHIPSTHPLIIDVTSLDYKWLFEYPRQHIATVNYFYMPTGKPVLFQLTAHSPFGAFWIPNLGGMEYTMPNRVLPLWLEATRPGVYMGRNANYSGVDFWRMTFYAHAVRPAAFQAWVQQVKQSKPPMTEREYRTLATHFDLVGQQSYSAYPSDTFPERFREFTIEGLHYVPTRHP
jgi:cytochrome aa3-600 menaquinol oxidase subunit 2